MVVKDSGKTFDSYSEMARLLRSSNWRPGKIVKEGEVVTVVGSREHQSQKDEIVVLVENLNGDQILIGEGGLSLAPIGTVKGRAREDVREKTPKNVQLYCNILTWLYTNDEAYRSKNEWRKEFLNFLQDQLEMSEKGK